MDVGDGGAQRAERDIGAQSINVCASWNVGASTILSSLRRRVEIPRYHTGHPCFYFCRSVGVVWSSLKCMTHTNNNDGTVLSLFRDFV